MSDAVPAQTPAIADALTPVFSSSVLHRSLRSDPMTVISAKGHYLTLSSGRRVLDACAGAAVACLGHGDENIAAAMAEQMMKMSYIHSQVYTGEPIEELARILVGSTGGKMERALFMNSGSEANEIAMKLARQYHLEKIPPEPQRDIFLSREQSYHGATFATLALSGHLARQARYKPLMLPNMRKTLPCNAYRYQLNGETEEEYAQRLTQRLEDDILRAGKDRVVAFVAETVGGASTGCVPPAKGYFRAVRDICDKYDVLLILDEIMCGVGRTGTMHAWEQEGISPDIQTVAKGLGGGYVPIGAVMMNKKVFKALDDGSGSFSHGQTFQSHLLSCAIAATVLRTILQPLNTTSFNESSETLITRGQRLGEYLYSRLLKRLSHLPHVGDIRGRGLFIGIEFVANKNTKEPFEAKYAFAGKVHARALELGVATYPGQGTADGWKGDHILLAPPFTVTEEECDVIVEMLERVLCELS